MSANTPIAGLTYPSLADAPNVPSNMQTLATQLDQLVIPRFASAAAMTTAIPSPQAGQNVYRSDLGYVLFYNGTSWVGESWALLGSVAMAAATTATLSISAHVYHRHLKIVIKNARSSGTTGMRVLGLRFNADATSGHYTGMGTFLNGGDAALDAAPTPSISSWDNSVAGLPSTQCWLGYAPGSDFNANATASGEYLVNGYQDTNHMKNVQGFNCLTNGGAAATGNWVTTFGNWNSATAITSLTVTADTATTATIDVYGV